MQEYQVILKCCVVHHYYKDGRCRGVDLQLSPQTSELLRRRGCLLKQIGQNEWIVAGDGEVEWDKEDELVFEVKIKAPDFLYFTMARSLKEEIRIFPCLQSGEISLEFEVKCLYWEYILIARNGRERDRLELVETSGRLNFTPMEESEWEGGKVFRTVSLEPVELRETYDFELRLVEVMPMGRRIVCRELKFPVPGQFVTRLKEGLRQIIYY